MHGADIVIGAHLQAVLQDRRAAVAPSPYHTNISTLFANAVNGACKSTILNGGGRSLAVADDAASIIGTGVDSGSYDTTLYRAGTVNKTYETRRMASVGCDGSGHIQVLNGGSVDIAEKGGARISVVGDGSSDSVAVAKENAAEGVLLRFARYRTAFLTDFDVSSQFHILATETGSTVYVISEAVPFFCIADNIRIILCSSTSEGVKHRDVDYLGTSVFAISCCCDDERIVTCLVEIDGKLINVVAIQRGGIVGTQ